MFLKGKRSMLEPLDPAAVAEVAARWVNDREVTHFMFYGQLPTTVTQVRAMLEAQLADTAKVLFLVKTIRGKPVGFAGLHDIHLTARKAEFRILIGEKRAWGKGIGTEVTKLLTHYAFDCLNLHRVYLGVTSENKGAVRAYEKAGFLREGVLKDDIYRNGRYYDTIRMGIIRTTR